MAASRSKLERVRRVSSERFHPLPFCVPSLHERRRSSSSRTFASQLFTTPSCGVESEEHVWLVVSNRRSMERVVVECPHPSSSLFSRRLVHTRAQRLLSPLKHHRSQSLPPLLQFYLPFKPIPLQQPSQNRPSHDKSREVEVERSHSSSLLHSSHQFPVSPTPCLLLAAPTWPPPRRTTSSACRPSSRPPGRRPARR